MKFRVKFISRENNEKFGFEAEVCALDGLDAARAAIGIDVPVDRISDEIEWFNEDHVREISEAEARSFGGYEKALWRQIVVDGFVEKYRKIKYNSQRHPETDAIMYVTPAFDFDFDALFEDWKAAGCPDTLRIAEI